MIDFTKLLNTESLKIKSSPKAEIDENINNGLANFKEIFSEQINALNQQGPLNNIFYNNIGANQLKSNTDDFMQRIETIRNENNIIKEKGLNTGPIDNNLKDRTFEDKKVQNNERSERDQDIKAAQKKIHGEREKSESSSADRIDSRIKEDEAIEANKIKKIISRLLKNLQFLLNMLTGEKGLKDEAREIKGLLKLLQNNDTSKNLKGRDKALLNEILSKLNKLLNKIDTKTSGNLKNKFLDDLADIKNELSRIAKTLSKNDANSANKTLQEKPDNDTVNIKNNTNEKAVALQDNNLKFQETDNSGKNDSNMNFQFFKNNPQTLKNISNPVNSRGNSQFSQQLESIIQNARIYVKDSRNGNFSLKLFPENLGKINVNLGLEQGILSGKFLVDNLESKNLLMENISIIKEKLAEQGISVGEFQVNVRDERKDFSGRPESFMPEYINPLNNDMSGHFEINTVIKHDGEIDMII